MWQFSGPHGPACGQNQHSQSDPNHPANGPDHAKNQAKWQGHHKPMSSQSSFQPLDSKPRDVRQKNIPQMLNSLGPDNIDDIMEDVVV